MLFIDAIDGYISPSQERFSVYHLKELVIPDVKKLCFKYTVTELATAVKPFLLRFLLSQLELREIIYLDPDILIFDPLTPLFELLEVTDVVVTPHLDKDYPEDGKFPDDSHIMRSGIFNLGFIGIRNSENARDFLDWWAGKMLDQCVIDHGKGYFVDQKFIDLAFTLFDNIHVEKDTGYNTAYWNLHSRHVENKDGRWLCNGKPLRFFHFSNYKPEMPHVLSRLQNRFNLSEEPFLKALFSLYTESLRQARLC